MIEIVYCVPQSVQASGRTQLLSLFFFMFMVPCIIIYSMK